jgi:hypothetical protein
LTAISDNSLMSSDRRDHRQLLRTIYVGGQDYISHWNARAGDLSNMKPGIRQETVQTVQY